MTYRHEINNETTLELLETVSNIYKACDIANSYSSAVSVAVSEFKGKLRVNLRELVLCTSKRFMSYLTFPLMRTWKDSGRGLLIKDLGCPEDYCIGSWKRYPELVDYVEQKLVEAPAWGIEKAPESKNLIVADEVRWALLEVQERFNLETLDEALTLILNRTGAMRFVVFLTRLVHDETTPEEADQFFRRFGSFYYLFAYERDDEHIKVVHEFFPYNYNVEFTKLVR